MTLPPHAFVRTFRGRSLQIYEEITNTMYNERRLELDLEGGSPRGDVLLLLGSASAFKQRGQRREPIASIGSATIGLLSVAHHQVAGRVVELVGQHVHDGLVRGHHDGRVRDLPDQLRSEATKI